MRASILAAALMACCATAAAHAAESKAPPAATGDGEVSATPVAPASGTAMRAGFDRATGRFRNLTPEEMEALRARAAERGQGMGLLRRAGLAPPATDEEAQAQAVTLADGSVITPVSEDLMLSLEARIGEDGTLEVTHSDGRLDHVHGHAAPAKASKEHAHE